ncbi:MAG: DUF2064 domain-containing protein [Thermoleophilaceae bacterium]
MIDATLMVIAKEPVAGRVKTRLCPPCSAVEAAELAEASLRDTLAVANQVAVGERLLMLDGTAGEWVPQGWRVERQPLGGLGDRIADAFAAVRLWPALLIGMDTPQITPALLEESATILSSPSVDAVLGPSEDGGYWAIGLGEANPRVFAGIPMSTEHTAALQRRRLDLLGLRVAELPRLRDIDTFADARAVAALAPQTQLAVVLGRLEEASAGAAPATARP